MDRNVVTALVSLPRVRAAGSWRPEQPASATSENLSRFSGTAKGFNVVMVSLESTAAQYVSGSVMPHLTSLAQHALVFENAYAVYPESIKGLFSVLCAQFPAIDSTAESYDHAPCESLPSMLAGYGYRTGLFHSGRFGYLGMESIVRRRGYQTLEDAGDIGGNHQSSFGVDEPATVARILRWIDTGPKPFFLTYLPVAGHHPYATPRRGPFPVASEFDQYRNALHYGDESLGELADGLRSRGLESNTVWVIYGDHGEAFGQHPGNYGHTFFVYEENVHVPLLIVVPGAIQHRQPVRRVVSLVDLAPTILDLVCLHRPRSYQGRTMLDATGRTAFFFADYSLRILGLRDGPWKFTYEVDSGRTKLFDLEHDPAETRDVAAGERSRAAGYRRLLDSIYYH
jgi:phosphoglycerol transferase MdoB-like AlkP superfamily enzyme